MNSAIDKRQARRAFSRAAAAGGNNAVADIVGERLEERLTEIAPAPQVAIDVGGNGHTLATHFPAAKIIALDFALPVLRTETAAHFYALADAEAMPLADSSADLLWSNLCWEWTVMETALAEAARVLSPTGGLLAFSVLGPDTWQEVRAAWAKVELPPPQRVHTFTDMHNIGDMLSQAGFAEPVLSAEHLTLSYSSAAEALRDAHNAGAGCALSTRPRGLMGRHKWQLMLDTYQQMFADDQGRVPATFEVIYATAWSAPPKESVVHFWDGLKNS